MLASDRMLPRGGTELLVENLIKRCGTDWQKHMNMVLTAKPGFIVPNDKPTILWCHLNCDNENVQGLDDPGIRDRFAHYVFVSHHQFQRFNQRFGISGDRATVIKNAIDPIAPVAKAQNEPVRLIYTSMPWRGLDILLDAYEMIRRDDILLDVYSSLKIYGSDYEDQAKAQWQPLFDRAASMQGVTYHGYAPNEQVRAAVQRAHMWTYPSIFEETSCLSAIEAGAAGCRMIASNLGALPETCAEYGELIPYGGLRSQFVRRFADAIVKCVNQHHDPGVQFMLRDQTVYFNELYGWERRANQWNHFFERIKQMSDTTGQNTPQLIPGSLTPGMMTRNERSGTTLQTPAIDIVSAAATNTTPARKVLIGTPSYDGRIDVWYVNSLYETMQMSDQYNYQIKPIWVSFDSLIQRARNDLFYYMIEGGYDDIIFIDGDIEWQPQWFFKLLSYDVDVVGGTYPKKGDIEEYVVKHPSMTPVYADNGLLKVDGLGTGFLRMSRKACQYLWDRGTPYTHNGKNQRWVFHVGIQDGDIVSEDIDACQKLRDGGFDIWLDTDMTCNHQGAKKFTGNFKQWFAKLPDLVKPRPVIQSATQVLRPADSFQLPLAKPANQGPQRRFRG